MSSSSLSGGTAYVDVALGKTDDLQRGIATAGEGAADTAKSSFLGRVGSIALGGALGNALSSGISSAFSMGKEAVFGFNSELQQADIGFTTMLGSAGKSKQFLDQLQTFAKSTPFEFGNLVSNAQNMMGMGIAAQDVIPDLTALGDSVASIGGSASQVDSVTLAFDQMAAKGTLDMGNINQLMQGGVPNALKVMADHYKVTTGQMIQMISTGKVQSSEALPALVQGIEKGTASTAALGGMMDKQSRTMAGALSNIKDSATQALAGAFKPVFDAASGAAQGLANFLGSGAITDASKKVSGGLTRAFQGVQAAIDGVKDGWKNADELFGKGAYPITELGVKAHVAFDAIHTDTLGFIDGFKNATAYAGMPTYAITTIGVKAREAWDRAKPLASELWDKIKSGVQTVGPILKTLFLDRLDTLKTIALDAYPIVVNLARGIGPVLGQVLRAAGDLITQHVLPAMLKISQFVQQQLIPRVADLVAFAVQHLIPVFHQIGDVIAQKVAPMIGRLVDLFVQKVLPALQPLIKDGFELLKDAIAKLTPIAQDLIRWFSENALPVIESIAKILIGKLIPFVLQVADVLIKVLRPAFDIAVAILRDVVIPAFKAGAGIFLTLEDAGAHMAGAITDAIHGIAKVISWLWDNVVSPQFKLIGDGVHTLSTIFHDVFDGMGKIISAGFTDAVALVKAPINGIIGLINGAIRALNSISVDIPDWVPGVGGESFGIHLSEISTLATGGLVLPTPGGSVVRVAEAGQAEIVSPIPTMEAAMSRVLARAKVGRDAPLIGTVNVPGSLSAQGVAEYLYAKIGARGLATA
jgi:tape measure domain-containing protein